MVNPRLRVSNLIDSFCDISNEFANASRARKIKAAFVLHTLMCVLMIVSLPKDVIEKSIIGFSLMAGGIFIRALIGFTYKKGTPQKEKMWAAVFSAMSVGIAASWSLFAVTAILAIGHLDEDSVMLLVLSTGFAGAGAVTLLPDRSLALAHVSCLLLPVAFVFSTAQAGHSFRITLVILAYLGFLLRQLQSQSSILRELFYRQEKYEALAKAAQEIVIIHRDGIVLEVNPAFEKEFGYKAEEIIGRHTMPLVPMEDHDEIREILKHEKSGKRIARLQRKDGSVFKGEVDSRFFTYREMKCKMVCIQNATERLAAEEATLGASKLMEAHAIERSREALESARMKSEFLANMSHEIRTPLNAIIGIIELLGDTYPNDVQKRYLRTMSESSELLLTLINDVLDFSKIDAGKLELENLQFSITGVIESQADLLSSRAQMKGVNIVTSIDSDLPAEVRGDSGRIGQILLNLIGNAIKFTSRGHIEVRALLDSEEANKAVVRFEVADTGEGLAPGVAERLFRPFTQADSSTSRKHGGTGLGLSICKRLVEAMGGTIGVDSVPGSGSKFWFTLHLEVIDKETIRSKFTRGDWSARQIFVMTDENSSARAVGRYLQSWGLTPTMGSSAWIKPAGKRVYDAVIVSASYRRRTKFKFDGPVIEIQNEGGPYNGLEGAFASLTNPVRQSDLYNVILNALALSTPPQLSAVPSVIQPSAEIVAGTPPADGGVLRIEARVLVAEDNTTNQMLALAHLRKLGISAQPVSNGVEALEALARGSYDLVLMDCQMPEMDGFEATRRIREIEKTKGGHIPIVALTANAFEEDRQRCLAVGMDAYIAKPLRREQLVTILKQLLVRAA